MINQNKIRDFISISIILLVGLLSITWFRGDFLIAGGDLLFPPDRWQTFLRTFYVWDSASLGGPNFRIIAGSIPYEVFRAFTDIIALPLINSEELWFYLMFTSSGLSMYYLTTTVIRKGYRHLAGVTSALFYMLNPFVAVYVVPQLWLFIIFLPLILCLYIKGLEEEKGLKYIFLMCVVWGLTTNSVYINPKLALFNWAPIFFYLTFLVLVNRNKKQLMRSLRFTGLLLALWSVLNAYWLLPLVFNLKETIASTLSAYAAIGTPRLESYSLGSAPLAGAFRLLGFWALGATYKGFPYFYWASTYSTPFFIAIGFSIPILAFTSLLHKPKDKKVLFFGIVTVIGLFIMNGSNPPLGWINEYIVTHVPLVIDVVSNPYMYGGMCVALGYAFLLGYAISALCSCKWSVKKLFNFPKSQSLKYFITGLLLFLIIGLYAFPLWNGEVIYSGNDVLASNRYNIPSYYYEAENWLSTDQGDFRLFPLPYSILGYAAYNWTPAGFNGPDPTESILNRPVVSGLSGGGIGMYVANCFVSNSTDELAKILALMNVKYVLFHRDVNWQFLEGNGWYISTSSENFQSILNSQSGLYLEKSFGELDFYRNEYWSPMDIYAATNNILVDGNLSQLIPIAQTNNFEPSKSVLLFSDQLSASQVSTFPMDTTFFQDTDFLNLVLSEVDGSITTSLNDKPTYVQNGAITINTTIAVDTPQESAIWLEMPSTSNQEKLSITLDGTIIANESELSINSFTSSSWTQIGKTSLSKGLHTLTLTVTNGQTLPTRIMFIPDQALNSVFEKLYNSLAQTRIIYSLEPQPLISASYYTGWKGVISTNGNGDPGMFVFPSPTSCPYISSFPLNFTDWNAYYSTLIYITTASSPLTINSISSDGTQTSAYAWWETGTSWETGWPITIPPNQRAIIQVFHQANTISLQKGSNTITLSVTDGRANPPLTKTPSDTSTIIFTPETENYLLAANVATGYGYGNLSIKIDNQIASINTNSQEQGPVFTYKYVGPINLTAGYHTISTSGENTSIPVYDESANPINWTSTFTNQNYAARYYIDWKAVVRTDGSEPWDTLSFPTTAQSPYTFPLNFTSWNAYNSTLVYLTTGNNPLRIDEILADGNATSDIGGVWWETGYMGMATKPVTYPIIIPPNQTAIIQINHKADNVTLETNPPQIDSMLLYSLKNGESFVDADNLLSSNQTNNTSITYEEINPTQYTVHVNSSKPFYLIFSEFYDNGWVATINGQQIPDQYHFTANGYANGWYINKTGTYTITLEFTPQNLFYAGATISIATLIICSVYISKNKIKSICQRYVRKKVSN